jgi:hypothetical protein
MITVYISPSGENQWAVQVMVDNADHTYAILNGDRNKLQERIGDAIARELERASED